MVKFKGVVVFRSHLGLYSNLVCIVLAFVGCQSRRSQRPRCSQKGLDCTHDAGSGKQRVCLRNNLSISFTCVLNIPCETGWWFGTFFIFPYMGLLIIPIDELIFFGGVAEPPTSHLPTFDLGEGNSWICGRSIVGCLKNTY